MKSSPLAGNCWIFASTSWICVTVPQAHFGTLKMRQCIVLAEVLCHYCSLLIWSTGLAVPIDTVSKNVESIISKGQEQIDSTLLRLRRSWQVFSSLTSILCYTIIVEFGGWAQPKWIHCMRAKHGKARFEVWVIDPKGVDKNLLLVPVISFWIGPW